MYYFKPNEETGRVYALLQLNQNADLTKYADYLTTETFPGIPHTEDGFYPELYYVDGQLTWKIVEKPVVVDEEPATEEMAEDIGHPTVHEE